MTDAMKLMKFPVLCLAREGSICSALDANDLCSCNTMALFKNRYFEGLSIFDAAGHHFIVRSAVPVSPLSGLSLLFARLVNKRLKVRIEIESTAAVSLNRVKESMVQWLHKQPEFWEASRDLRDWERAVTKASGVPSLAALFQ